MPFTDVQERADGCCESENGKVRQLAPESVLRTQKLKSCVSSETREVPLQTGDLMESYTSVRFFAGGKQGGTADKCCLFVPETLLRLRFQGIFVLYGL